MDSLATNPCGKKLFLTDMLDDFSALSEKAPKLLFENLSNNDAVKKFSDFTNCETDLEFKPFTLENAGSAALILEHKQINELTEKFKKQINELEEKHRHELELVSAKIRAEEGKHLLEFLEKAISDLRSSISEQVGKALGAFLACVFKKEAVEKFAQKLKLSLMCNTSSLIIEGNRELLDLLALFIGEEGGKFKFKETDSLELSFKYHDKVLATNIESLLAELGGNKL